MYLALHDRTVAAPAPYAVRRPVRDAMRWIADRRRAMRRSLQARRAMSGLDDRGLQDLGISRAQAGFMATHRLDRR